MESEENSSWNGLILNSCNVPEEVLTHLLSFVDPKLLVFQCRSVCRRWRNTITDTRVWELKIKRSNTHSLSEYSSSERKKLMVGCPWYLYYWILNDVPFEQNILANNCGSSEKSAIEPDTMRSPGKAFWDFEGEPREPRSDESDFLEEAWCHNDLCDAFLEVEGELQSDECDNFVGGAACCHNNLYTSYNGIEDLRGLYMMKVQMVDLRTNRFPLQLVNEFQPTITITACYRGRQEYGCEYTLQTRLLDRNQRDIIEVPLIKRRTTWGQGEEQNMVTRAINNYGPGLRFIKLQYYKTGTSFDHTADGVKVAGSVKISLPEIRDRVGSKLQPVITEYYD